MKRANNVFDYQTEELDKEWTKRIKKLSDKEYFIYMSRGNNKTNKALYYLLGIISVIIIYGLYNLLVI